MLLATVCAPLAARAFQYGGPHGTASLTGYVEVRGACAFERDTPEEDPSGELGLELKASSASWNSLKVFIQGVQDGTVIDPGSSRVFNDFDRVYQDRSPSVDIDEAYVDFYTGDVDIRVGVQKFAWGRLDEVNPTDNLNTEDLTEGGTNDEVDRKIGVPALKVNLYSNLANVEIGWVPFYVPYRLPTAEERWFPGVLVPPSTIDAGHSVGTIPVRASYPEIDLPRGTIENSEAGIRVSRHIGGWDVSASYFTGYDMMPLVDTPVDLDVELADPLALDYDVTARVAMEPVLHRMHVFGLDFTTTVSDFTLRGEYAYFHNKHYNRKLDSILEELVTRDRIDAILSDFLADYLTSGGRDTRQTFRLDPETDVQMDAMKYGLGLDYIHGDTSVSVQCIQEFIPDYDSDRPVYFNKDGLDTLLTFLFKQFFLQNTMEFNLRAAYDIEFKDYIARPSLTYSFTDRLQGTVGLIVIGGKYDDSLLGQFQDNDQAFARLRCSF